MGQSWNPNTYSRDARFVSDLATSVVDLLAPAPDERILDLGCGDGVLTRRLADLGCDIVGVDSSPAMVEAAVKLGIDARVMDATDLSFQGEFDAVFSNAALHWMNQPDAVIQGVSRALKDGGRFVGEFGGHGNIATVYKALNRALERRGVAPDTVDPWYFPTAEEYRARLETGSMRVLECTLIPRPTPLDNDLMSWLRIFARRFLVALPDSEHEAFLDEVSTSCQGQLMDGRGRWTIDYVRLRFSARKP